MNYKIKKIATNWRVIILAIFIILSLVAIHPTFSKGAAIRSVATNSSASIAGILQPKPNIQPVLRERILSVNNVAINTVEDYYKVVSSLPPNKSVSIKTNKQLYRLATKEKTQELGIRVFDAPSTNLRKGLDLQGGTRVLLQPETKLNPYDMGILIENMRQRLNVYGLSDLIIREANDMPPPLGTGNQYIVVEIAGATEEEVKELLAKQGKFEAKISNKTIFRGGQDIVYVGRSAQEARIESCNPSGGQYFCSFSFSITLSQDAAQRQADATRDLTILPGTSGNSAYLSDKLELFLDDKKVDELNIAADLKGQAQTQIAISGPGFGTNIQEAQLNTAENMKRLQTILITGSLPVKMSIVKTDSISPVLGEEFVRNALIMAILAALAVSIVIGLRYRKLVIAIPIMITLFSEVLIVLGVAAFIGWNMDLAAIAGILVAIGTGVNDQIVITDETLKGETSTNAYNFKEKIKRAFLIIMLAYFTIVVAMIPLIFAGAGLLKGFAITTIIGVTIGVFVTRPAYSSFIEVILK